MNPNNGMNGMDMNGMGMNGMSMNGMINNDNMSNGMNGNMFNMQFNPYGMNMPIQNNMMNPMMMNPMIMQQHIMQQQMMQQNMMQQQMMQNIIEKAVDNAVKKVVGNITIPAIENNIDSLMQINEINDADENENEDIDDETVVIQKNKKQRNMPIAKEPKKKTDDNKKQKDDKVIENFLAGIFDKSLDSNRNKEPKDNSFGIDKKNCNIIIGMTPKNKDEAHFNKVTHPNEVYVIQFMGARDYDELYAIDLNEYALETHKYINEHNNSIRSTAMTMQGFIYARSSSDNTVSINTQRDSCFKYAMENGIGLLRFGYQYDNNVTGRNMANMEQELGYWFEHIPNGSHTIIYSVDRLSRNVAKGIVFIQNAVSRNITLHFVTNELKYGKDSSATSLGNIQTLLVDAEKFSNMTSEKIRNTHKRLLEEGHEFGRAKYGFQVDKSSGVRKLVRNEDEQEVVKKIKEKFNDVSENFDNYQQQENLKRTYQSIYEFIARWCARSGIKYRNDEPITDKIVHRIVKDKTYK